MYNIIEKWKANPSKIFAYESGNQFTGKDLYHLYNNVKINISLFYSLKYVILSGKNSLSWVLCYLACKDLKKELIVIPFNSLYEVLNIYRYLSKHSFIISDKKIKKRNIQQKSFNNIIKKPLKK